MGQVLKIEFSESFGNLLILEGSCIVWYRRNWMHEDGGGKAAATLIILRGWRQLPNVGRPGIKVKKCPGEGGNAPAKGSRGFWKDRGVNTIHFPGVSRKWVT